MSREYCQHCNYPTTTCVCSAVAVMNVKTQITLMLHPSEQNKAKNTGRLIPLLIPSAVIIVGESGEDFSSVKDRIREFPKTVVLFPCDISQSLTDISKEQEIEHIIVIDATWRKAKKIWMLNPWLHQLSVAHLNLDSISQYRIRKGSRENGVSSIEAVAAALEEIESVDTAPVWALFEAMQSNWP